MQHIVSVESSSLLPHSYLKLLEIFKAFLCEKKKFLICNKASFTEQDCVKESKIGLHLRKLKTNELSAHVYIE